MNVDILAKHVKNMQGRLTDLFHSASSVPVSLDLLPTAFKELGNASEELQVAVEELQQRNEELIAAQLAIQAESQRYYELLEFTPDGYLVTDIEGTIREANQAAGIMLSISTNFLIGKPLIVFVTQQERQEFRSKLLKLQYSDALTELTVRLQKRNGETFIATVRVATVRDQEGKRVALRWLLREDPEYKHAAIAINKDNKLCQDRPLQTYAKGEIVPLKSEAVFLVYQGLVKLSAFCENGAEILVGLAGPGKPFGIDITSLNTYQAIALSNVELVTISVAEIADSPSLCHKLLPRLNQRQQQTELFLFIAGQRLVKDRLCYFLQFLKQEIGQPVENGTRLSVRLTHEDIASACGTTRVTITRELGKLQQQGKITIDSKNHIVLKGESNWQSVEKGQLLKQ